MTVNRISLNKCITAASMLTSLPRAVAVNVIRRHTEFPFSSELMTCKPYMFDRLLSLTGVERASM